MKLYIIRHAEACWHEEREPSAQKWNPIPEGLSDFEKEIFMFRDNKEVIPEPLVPQLMNKLAISCRILDAE